MITKKQKGGYNNTEARAKRQAQYEYLLGFSELLWMKLCEYRKEHPENEAHYHWSDSFSRAHGYAHAQFFSAEGSFTFRVKCSWTSEEVILQLDREKHYLIQTVPDLSPEGAQKLIETILERAFKQSQPKEAK